MAKLTNKILGNVNGTIGNITFSKWKNSSVIRAKSEGGRTEFTVSQKIVQEKFKLISAHAKALLPILKAGFNDFTKDKTEYNVFFSENFGIITGTLGSLVIDYTKMILSKGGLETLNSLVASQATNAVKFDWSWNNYGIGIDKVVFIMFEPSLKTMITDETALRSANTYNLSYPTNWIGKQVHLYSFTKNEGNKTSPSTFVGSITLT
jgi:hypothetical protein